MTFVIFNLNGETFKYFPNIFKFFFFLLMTRTAVMCSWFVIVRHKVCQDVVIFKV